MKIQQLILSLLLSFSIFYDFSAQTKSLSENEIETRIQELIGKMTVEQKIGQMNLRGKSSRVKEIPEPLKDAIRNGNVGALLNITEPQQVLDLQKIAVTESPLGIPLLFGRDVIHGHKTIFPIPLGQAATWNPELVEQGAEIAAKEASSVGINWTFAPMIDVSRDPRWGRIAESSGEDPYLNSIMGKAYIKGFQGDNLTDNDRIVACAKHFAGYGAAQGGRDYNTVQLSEMEFYNVYSKPFLAATEMNVGTFMTAFNDLNGIPASGNKFLLQEVLRNQWNFKGFVVSDWNSVSEMIPHGYAKNEKHAAELGANAGCEMEMTSTTYEDHLKELLNEGKFTEEQLNETVANILRVKFKKGLFGNPYFEQKNKPYAKKSLEAATEAAVQSAVLLKNKNNVLPVPVSAGKKIAVTGPLANQPHEQLGTWTFDGDKTKSVTPLDALGKTYSFENITYVETLTHSRDTNESKFNDAIKAAEKSDILYFFGGEEAILSGEAHSRADISLPGAQIKLIEALHKTGKPIVLIIQAGRPITMSQILNKVDAVVMLWHAGIMAGPAVTQLLTGESNFSGKLPLTWPKSVGQIPIYYNHSNTGRPVEPEKFVGINDIPVGAWQSSLGNTSHYLDAGYEPLFPFGYGLSYTNFNYGKILLSKTKIASTEKLTATCKITNSGSVKGTEIVQLYIRDKVGSYVRPIRELKGFQRIALNPGESKSVSFEIGNKELEFFTPNRKWEVEPGEFEVWIAPNAVSGESVSFEVN